MLHHQLQGWNECLPTSIAMCLGIPKGEFVETCLLGTPYNFWAEVPADERNLLITAALRYWGETYEGDDWADTVLIPLPVPMLAVPLMAKSVGLLTVWNEAEDAGHAVAFDHGMVLDPAHEGGPVPLFYWATEAMMQGFVPFAIARAAEGGES